MNILHLQTELKIACGITKTIYLLAVNTLNEINSTVFTFGGDAVEKFKRGGINTIVSDNTRKGLYQTLNVLFRIVYLVRKHNIDIIHSHHRYFDFIAFLVSKLIPVKTSTSVQSKVYGKKVLSYKADHLIACSHSIKEHLISYFSIDPKKVEVIYNFVDPRDVKKQSEKATLIKELGIEESTIVIGFIGRFSIKEKGVDILLEAFKRISRDFINLKLVMIGEGEDKDFVENFITTNILNGVTLSSKENIFDYFDIIDIVVLPSRIDPLPLVMLESGLMKKAFIGADVDGIKELIEHEKDGLIFPCENVNSLISSLGILIQDKNLRVRLGEELYKKVMNNYSSDKILPVYNKTYQQLVKDDS